MADIPLRQKKYSVSIAYCVPCDYSQQALAAAEALVRDYQHLIGKLELVMGSQGTFEVRVDGDIIFTKAEEKRFPEAGELLSRFEQAVGGPIEKYPRG